MRKRGKKRAQFSRRLRGVILLIGAFLLIAHNTIPHHLEKDGCLSLSTSCQSISEENCCEKQSSTLSHCHHHTQYDDNCEIQTPTQKKEELSPDNLEENSVNQQRSVWFTILLKTDATELHQPPKEKIFYGIRECLSQQRRALFRARGFRAPPLA